MNTRTTLIISHTTLLLFAYCTITSMERPPAEMEPPRKKVCIPTPEKVYNPASLKEQTAKKIAKSLVLLTKNKRSVMELPSDCREQVTLPLLDVLKDKCSTPNIQVSRIASSRYCSQCYFLKNDRHVICFQEETGNCHIINSKSEALDTIPIKTDVASFTPSNDYKICFRRATEHDSPGFQGVLYSVDNYRLQEMIFARKQKRTGEKIKHSLREQNLVPPVNGQIDLAIPYSNSLLIKVTDTHSQALEQKLFFITKETSSPYLVESFAAHPKITHLQQGKDNSLFIIFENGAGKLNNYDSNVHKRFALCAQGNPPPPPPKAIDISPDYTKLVAGFENGMLSIYDIPKNSFECIADGNVLPCAALKFLDAHRVIVARNFETGEEKEELLLQIWDLRLKLPVAYTLQSETRRCNNLDTDSEKESLLLGMGYYDIGMQRISSFQAIMSIIDADKAYKRPDKLLALLKKSQPCLKEKLDFIAEHALTQAPE